jgi:uncharacterized membrane protein YhaH (DUF805 family)/uncharacterized protein YndB with AHSA1/START domain
MTSKWNPFEYRGELARTPYALWGVLLFVVKHNLSRALAGAAFDRPWGLFNYVRPADALRFSELAEADQTFFLVQVAISLPFIWMGVALSLRRLRSAGLPEALSALFFVPFVNLLFFVVIMAFPAREADSPAAGAGWFGRFVPRSGLGAAALAVGVSVPFGLAVALLSVFGLGSYGWGLFVGLPFCLGVGSVLLYTHHEPRSRKASLGVAALSVLLFGALCVAVAFEGVMCVTMAVPLAVPLALIGALFAHSATSKVRPGGVPLALLALTLPGLVAFEGTVPSPPELVQVQTSVVIDAPPQVVWDLVVDFPDLPEPDAWIFRHGISYPMSARLEGTGVGAVRYCEFNTGAFVEPITVWDAPHRLAFDVDEQPQPMTELSPWGEIDAPHLDDFLRSERGEFLLESLPDGGTRLTGTTWYRHQIGPQVYWEAWSSAIIGRIHRRVLEHVKLHAERSAPAGA